MANYLNGNICCKNVLFDLDYTLFDHIPSFQPVLFSNQSIQNVASTNSKYKEEPHQCVPCCFINYKNCDQGDAYR